MKINTKLSKGTVASALPVIDNALNLWRPVKIRDWCLWLRILDSYHIHVVAADLVLDAIAAARKVSLPQSANVCASDLPLRKCFVAANMSSFACLTTLSGLGVTAPGGACSAGRRHRYVGVLTRKRYSKRRWI